LHSPHRQHALVHRIEQHPQLVPARTTAFEEREMRIAQRDACRALDDHLDVAA
jgi:hypothetical protein